MVVVVCNYGYMYVCLCVFIMKRKQASPTVKFPGAVDFSQVVDVGPDDARLNR